MRSAVALRDPKVAEEGVYRFGDHGWPTTRMQGQLPSLDAVLEDSLAAGTLSEIPVFPLLHSPSYNEATSQGFGMMATGPDARGQFKPERPPTCDAIPASARRSSRLERQSRERR